MTLSRRDEFAARAMVALLEKATNPHQCAEAAGAGVELADALIAELDRTEKKVETSDVVDDGREIRCTIDSGFCKVAALGDFVRFTACDPTLTPEDAIVFAHRILKAAEEARKA